jgi:hypothetical protein
VPLATAREARHFAAMNDDTLSDAPFLSEDEKWMEPAVRELERLLGELAAATWPPSPWARHKFEIVLLAAEQGRYAEAYEGVLWSRNRFNRWCESAAGKPAAAAAPSLQDYQVRVDSVRSAATAMAASLDTPPAALDFQ